MRQAEALRTKFTHYSEVLLIQTEYDSFLELSNPDLPEFEKDVSRIQKKLSTFLQQTSPLADDTELAPLREACKLKLNESYRTLTHSRERRAEARKKKSPEADKSEGERTIFQERTRLDLEMPTFSGKPLEWRPFFKLFSSTLETRGKRLSDQERICLLLKAMKDENARQVVLLHSQGDDGYTKAIEALVNNFGSPSIIFPHHVRRTTARESIDFSKDGFTKLRQRFLLPYQAMKEMKVATLSQYLTALAYEDFTPRMKEEWTKHIADKSELPTLEDLFAYTEPLEYKMANIHIASSSTTEKSFAPRKPATNWSTSSKPNRSSCALCHEHHGLHRCPVFLGYDIPKRIKYMKEKKGCTNCLSLSHSCSSCPSSYTCKRCSQKHNTMLHKEDTGTSTSIPTVPGSSMLSVVDSTAPSIPSPEAPPVIAFLHTALVKAKNGNRECHARIALDTGSSSSLITEALASQLKLKRYPQRLSLTGAYGGGLSKHYVKLDFQSLHDESQQVTIKLSVVSRLPNAYPPNRKDEIAAVPHLKDLTLADPAFGGPLDALIGSLDYGKCILGSLTYHVASDIAVSPTLFGWTVTGPMDYEPPSSSVLKIQTAEDNLQQDLQLLWALDKTPETPTFNAVDEAAVYHFSDTHSIEEDGRYKVRLSRITNPPELGQSRHLALKRLQQNEKSLAKKGKLNEFNSALREYLQLGHAEEVTASELPLTHYYLPVHGVFKNSSTTTKIRPVFDASAKSSTGVSLNDLLHTGPNLYPLLSDILLRFRLHQIGYSADISKMFREVLLHEDERDLHRFLLRTSEGAIMDCRMKRLTFGVRPSPFLATQVIRHLARQYQDTHPKASRAVLRDFYVDDYVSGADTVEEAKEIRSQLCDLLKLAGMNLRKWRTSDEVFRKSIPAELVEMEDLALTLSNRSLKTLGIHWNIIRDELHVSTPEVDPNSSPTKRIVASISAKVFDTLGLFSPSTITAKILLQKLWKRQVSWDQPIPEELQLSWKTWLADLPLITSRPISRRYSLNPSPVVFRSLHGFSDASDLAYGAVVYLRQVHEDTSISVSLVMSKARVSPLKPLTTPRAELVAAYLLAKLLSYISDLLNISDLFAWTDSSIVLCWLRKLPSTLNTFVAHRVSAIQDLIPISKWHHVSTSHNPADLLSRGLPAVQLLTTDLWWEGPPWLKLSPEEWPQLQFVIPRSIPETKSVVLLSSPPQERFQLWKKYSSFHHLVCVVAWIRRFYSNLKLPSHSRKKSAILSTQETLAAKNRLLLLAQTQSFGDLVSNYRQGRCPPKLHFLSRYALSIDPDGILKASGRVRDPQDLKLARQRIPLSLNSDITSLMIRTLHLTYQHAGVSTLMSIIGKTYHIPGLRNELKKISRQCAICQRAYARPTHQQMGLLPSSRTTPSHPFEHTGMDFAGPFLVRQGHTRRPVLLKTYACLFVCFSTRAIHIELCADLTTEEFLAAFKRFCARRGTPTHLYSDNGSNFLGARNELQDIQRLHSMAKEPFTQLCSETSISWHFIPPRTPHFGGLWESGVKSMKLLLRKVISPHSLRFHELSTILTEVEAVLNSRPLKSMTSTDPNDIVLTPGHFLIGRPLKSPPTAQASQAKISSLRRWKLIQRLQQDLWQLWQATHIQSLESRNKWNTIEPDFNVGDLAYLKDETLGYRDWPIARVTSVYPGDDGHVRAVDVQCKGKVYRRPTHKLIRLYIDDQPSAPPPQDVRD